MNIEECDTTENQSGVQQNMVRGSTLASLTRISALCNRAEFKPGQVNYFSLVVLVFTSRKKLILQILRHEIAILFAIILF